MRYIAAVLGSVEGQSHPSEEGPGIWGMSPNF